MRTREELVAQSWAIALGHYLSEYPEDREPEQLLTLICEDDDDIVVWEPFWGFDREWVADQIETMQEYMFRELLWAQGVDA